MPPAMLFLSAMLWAVAAQTPAVEVAVPGQVIDAFDVGDGQNATIWLSVTKGASRELWRLNAKAATPSDVVVPPSAVFVDACGQDLIFADARGVVTSSGTRLIDTPTLFVVPDAQALLRGDICGDVGAAKGGVRIASVDGLVVSERGASRTLALRHSARVYSGRVDRGLRPERAYAQALSVYGPRMFDVDVDADGDVDLVVEREGRLWVFVRAPDGLSTQPTLNVDLSQKLGVSDADLRVRFLDHNADHRSDVLIGVTRGAVPDKSEAWLVSSTAAQPFSQPTLLWRKEGLWAPVGVVGAKAVIAEVNTSLMSLSRVVLTGSLPLRVHVGDDVALDLSTTIDVRGGKMEGALPVVSVDFDGDGHNDLLDLASASSATLYRGTASGFVREPVRTWRTLKFQTVVPLPSARAVLLIGATRQGVTRVQRLAL